MSKMKEFMMSACEFFGASDYWETEDDLNDAQRLAQLLWDLNDAATDYGRRLIVDPQSHQLRLELVRTSEEIEFADLALKPQPPFLANDTSGEFETHFMP